MTSKQNFLNDEYIRINNDKSENHYVKIEHDAADGIESKDIKNYIHEEKNDINLDKYNKKVIGASKQRYFCVFRVGKKIKSMSQVMQFEKHMQRDMEVPNADPSLTKYNRIIIGYSNVSENVQNYVYGIKLRNNANIGVDLVLTTSHDFFKDLPPQEREKWIEENIKFLKNNFGDNCVYACVHMDETTPHIHALIVPKFYDVNKKVYKLQSNKYFDGIQKMQNWQTQYANYMNSKFDNLMRGIKGSKAKHTDIKTYYSLITKKLDIQDDKQILAYAQRNYLLEKRTKALEFTLSKMQENGDVNKLLKKLEKIEKNNKVYKEIIKVITKKYGIKENEIYELVDKVQGKSNDKERQR